MRSQWQVHWEPKLGNSATEYEDAFWPPLGRAFAERFAVADGATESSYSREWAEALVARYGAGASWKTSFVKALPDLQADWRAHRTGINLPWFAEQKVQQGAYAAFLGIRLLEREGFLRLHALAAGDCELIHIAGGGVHCTFPLAHSSDFGIHPELIGTSTGRDSAHGMIRGRREDVRPGELLLLMTDAIAAWFLRGIEANERPWLTLEGLDPEDPVAFAGWVDSLRKSGAMRNDDVTLGIVRLL